MERRYGILYQLEFNHTYYESGKTNDFAWTPIGDTKTMLNAQGLILKIIPSGIFLGYQMVDNDGNPQIPFSQAEKLWFGISLINAEVLHISALPNKTNSTDIYYASGKYDTGVLTWTIKSTRLPVFTELYTYTHINVELKIADENDNIVTSIKQEGTKNPIDPTKYDFAFSVELEGIRLPGIYTLKTYAGNTLLDEREVIIADRDTLTRYMGIVAIELDELINYNAVPYKAKINMDAAESVWIYHIELTRDYTGGNFKIKNTDDGSTVSFAEKADPAAYEIGRIVTFTSSEPIPKSERPLTNFNLEVTSDTTDYTLNKLPNPSVFNANSIVYLKI